MAIGYNESQRVGKEIAPQPFNEQTYQRKYEVMDSNQLKTEINKLQKELQELKNNTNNDKFKGERLKVAEQKIAFAKEMLQEIEKDEKRGR
jgi:hypothetical protein